MTLRCPHCGEEVTLEQLEREEARGAGTFVRFTEEARRVVTAASDLARVHPRDGVMIDDVRAALQGARLTPPPGTVGQIPFTRPVKWLLEQALHVALGVGARELTPEHLSAALVRYDAGEMPAE